MTLALVLIAHGSRHSDANDDTFHMAERLRERGFPLVQAAFLELAEPDIDTAAEICVNQGAKRVVLLPYFLSAGVHVRRDLTAAAERLERRFSEVEFTLAEPIGRHPLLADVLVARTEESLPLKLPKK
jgi:sirohydrochlorin ferrochelatase